MRIQVLFLMVWLLMGAATSPKTSFGGKIVYVNTYADAEGNAVSNAFTDLMGSETRYFTDGANYKTLNEKDRLRQMYIRRTNSYYLFNDNSTAQKFDATVNFTAPGEITHLDGTESVMGYECKRVVIENDASKVTYWYTDQIKVDPAVFSGHAFGGWYEYLQATDGALNLKSRIEFKDQGFVMTSTAVEIMPMKLPESDFRIPEGYRVIE